MMICGRGIRSMMNRKSARYSLLLISLWWPLLHAAPCSAQGHVVLDGTLGSSGPLSGPNFNITAELGKTRGNNLFQSFSQFDLVNGDVATFSGPANIHNILARVTGNSPSMIDGTIQSSIQGANLFFINPFGVMFGSHAQVSVLGSFAVTSASYLKLSGGGRFDAANPANDVLTTAPVSAFGFSGTPDTPGSISIDQSTLVVPAGQSFSVIGGDITMNGATIQAPGGRVNLVSVKSAGQLALNVTDFAALPNTRAFTTLGQITVQNAVAVQSTIDASGDGGGQVVIRGGTLVVQGSVIEANTLGASAGKGIDIKVTGDLAVNGGAISTDTAGSGNGGAITITAGAISLDGQGSAGGILSDVEATGSGNGGNVRIMTPTLEILNGARVSAATGAAGNGGNVDVNADNIHIDAEGTVLQTGVTVISLNDPGGNAGSIRIRPLTGKLALQIVDGGEVSADTQGSGSAGSIDIVADSVLLDGQTASGFTGIAARTFGTGGAGEITIHQTRLLTMLYGAEIDAETQGFGRGGDINIAAKTIDMESSSVISAATIGEGSGGGITLTAKAIHLDGEAKISAGNNDGFDGDAPAGDIAIKTGSLDVLNGAQISTDVKAGDGGNISITANSDIHVLDGNITASAANDGGNITVAAVSVIDLQNGQITADAGNKGGNISLGSPLFIFDPVFTGSGDSTSIITANAGNVGGKITIERNFSIDPLNVTASGGRENGTVKFVGPNLDLTGSVLPLRAVPLDAEAQLQPYCGMKLSGDISSFLVLGKGGVALEPSGASPSFELPPSDNETR
jgi:filamentous hemagglutinin family protein